MDGRLIQHKELAASGRWSEMPFAEQMANVGSEVFRAGKWKEKGREDRAMRAADRALELLDFTVAAQPRQSAGIRELLTLREVLCDFYYGENEYHSTADSLYRYFAPFSGMAARLRALSVRNADQDCSGNSICPE